MFVYWSECVLLAIWTVAFVCSHVFYEGYTRRPRPAVRTVVAPRLPLPESEPELPSLLARALEQVEDQTFPVTRDHLTNV